MSGVFVIHEISLKSDMGFYVIGDTRGAWKDPDFEWSQLYSGRKDLHGQTRNWTTCNSCAEQNSRVVGSVIHLVVNWCQIYINKSRSLVSYIQPSLLNRGNTCSTFNDTVVVRTSTRFMWKSVVPFVTKIAIILLKRGQQHNT